METYGEDPYLAGEMGVQFVKGLQGNNPKYLKTYARDIWEYAILAFQIRLRRSKINLWLK